MTTTRASRSIEIKAPVEEVFALIDDPYQSMSLMEKDKQAQVSSVETAEDGSVTSYEWTAWIPMLHHDLRGTSTVMERELNRRLVVSSSTGPVMTWEVEPAGEGTRLTFSEEISSRIPLWEKVEVFAAAPHGLNQFHDEMLARIKERLEA